MAHLWDPLPASYRPLIFYAITEALDYLTRAMLWVSVLRLGVVGWTGRCWLVAWLVVVVVVVVVGLKLSADYKLSQDHQH